MGIPYSNSVPDADEEMTKKLGENHLFLQTLQTKNWSYLVAQITKTRMYFWKS